MKQMIATLEALQARHGDCLLLYYGEINNLKVIVIDGGPSQIYQQFLKPRLLQIKKKLSPQKPLSLSMIMVSHLDDDHINGILVMTDEMVDKEEENGVHDFVFKNIWCNTFDDIIGNIEIPKISTLPASATPAGISSLPIRNAEPHIAAFITSTGQGRKLRNNAERLSVSVNNPFMPVSAGKANLVHDGEKTIKWESSLNIKVIHPNEQRLKELQEKWDKDLKAAKAKGDDDIIIASIINPDISPFNLSSIVCLLEFGKKTMLLTGDARSDDIVSGLKKHKLLNSKGKLHVNILKVPHHGSIRNMDKEFFGVVSADHYVISADGKHDNPDQQLLDILSEKVLKGTIHFTNHDGEKGLKKKLDGFEKRLKDNDSKVKVKYRKEAGSIIINLLDKLQF